MSENNLLTLPSGFSSRPCTLNDAGSISDLINASSRFHLGVEQSTPNTEYQYLQTPGLNMKTDTLLVFSPEGQLAAHGNVWANILPPVHPFIWVRVHPDFENLGLGTFLNLWAEQRCYKLVDEVPENARISMRTIFYAQLKPASRLLENLGWSVIRHNLRMRIEFDSPSPEPRWPYGIKLRPFKFERDIEDLYCVQDEIFRDHFGYIEQSYEEGFANFKHYAEFDTYDPEIWYVAVDGDQIAGMVLCLQSSLEHPEEGYVLILGVRRRWRKQGLGLALLHHAFGEFYTRGKSGVSLHLDAANLTGAIKLYKRAGMHIHRQSDMLEKEIRPGIELEKTNL
jgi:GNAT superfamily N-acetyltransferase